jgi:hypothetical protein
LRLALSIPVTMDATLCPISLGDMLTVLALFFCRRTWWTLRPDSSTHSQSPVRTTTFIKVDSLEPSIIGELTPACLTLCCECTPHTAHSSPCQLNACRGIIVMGHQCISLGRFVEAASERRRNEDDEDSGQARARRPRTSRFDDSNHHHETIDIYPAKSDNEQVRLSTQ